MNKYKRGFKNVKSNLKKNLTKGEGTYRAYLDPKCEDTATDIYYKTEYKLKDSDVAIPTEDAVVEAKDWVDDANKM
ncbi:MAG TPA: DUF3787 domain-containing protein [Tissierellaceae bacterium]|nr:DUF3787 domain-containing protein [Tissierellaceae bacterium]